MVREPTDERSDIEEALVALCFERSFARVTVEALCEGAGVDRAAFDRLYESLEDCFCQTLEALRDDFFDYLDRGLAGQVRWVDRLRAIAYGLLRYLRADRPRTNFLAIELHLAGERATLIWSETIVKPLLDRIDEGRAESDSQATLSRATAEAVGGAVFSRINIAAEEGSLYDGGDVVPQLMYMAVLPYVGEEAAKDELSAPPTPDPGLG